MPPPPPAAAAVTLPRRLAHAALRQADDPGPWPSPSPSSPRLFTCLVVVIKYTTPPDSDADGWKLKNTHALLVVVHAPCATAAPPIW